MLIRLPEDVKVILNRLQAAGYEAYAVGGCIRDSLLSRSPDDWDITTCAKPEETKALFERTIDTGIQHGTVTVMRRGRGYEVTTYRVDGEYEDGRHPKEVTFTASLEEDLKRRDFTVNAMAYNEKEGLVDPFGGRADLAARQVRRLPVLEGGKVVGMVSLGDLAKCRQFDMEAGKALSEISDPVKKIEG